MDGLAVGVTRLPFRVTEANIDQVAESAADRVEAGFQPSGRITSNPTVVTVGGRPAFRLELSFQKPGGEPLQSQMIFIFDGATEYFVNCQFTQERAEEMKQGCEQVVNSFPGEVIRGAAGPEAFCGKGGELNVLQLGNI